MIYQYTILPRGGEQINCTPAQLDDCLIEFHINGNASGGWLVDNVNRIWHDLEEQASCAWHAQETEREAVILPQWLQGAEV